MEPHNLIATALHATFSSAALRHHMVKCNSLHVRRNLNLFVILTPYLTSCIITVCISCAFIPCRPT